jgi:putative PIN family toxin of toxin-antitoxin system
MIAHMLSSKLDRVVVDTNVLAGALIGRAGSNRWVIRACLEGRLKPLIGQALFLEYEDVLSRKGLYRSSPLSPAERRELFAAFLSVCEWVQIYFSWRPNLPDESDNHILELAVAGGAAAIITNNIRDFHAAELKFPGLRVVTPRELAQEHQ